MAISIEICSYSKILLACTGKIFGVEMHMVADQTRLTRPGYGERWEASKARAGGGHLIWLGIHWLDLAMSVHATAQALCPDFCSFF